MLGALAGSVLLAVAWSYNRRTREMQLHAWPAQAFEPLQTREWHPKTYWWEGKL